MNLIINLKLSAWLINLTIKNKKNILFISNIIYLLCY